MTTINPGDLIPASQINQWCPPGLISPYGGSVAPSGWLLCDGASYLRTDYPDLFAAIGTTYGAADGTHFNVPDLRGRAIVGHAAAGGHADVSTIGANDGVAAANRRAKHRHTAHNHGGATGNDSPDHTHTVPTQNAGGSLYGGGAFNAAQAGSESTGGASARHTHSISSVDGGSGNANDSLDAPAYLVIPYIIRAKDV